MGEGCDTRLPGGTVLTSKTSRQARFAVATPGQTRPGWGTRPLGLAGDRKVGTTLLDEPRSRLGTWRDACLHPVPVAARRLVG